MGILTNFLKLLKPEENNYYNAITEQSENWQKVDDWAKKVNDTLNISMVARGEFPGFDGTYNDFRNKIKNGVYIIKPNNLQGLNLPEEAYTFGTLLVSHNDRYAANITYISDGAGNISGVGNRGGIYVYNTWNFYDNSFSKDNWVKMHTNKTFNPDDKVSKSGDTIDGNLKFNNQKNGVGFAITTQDDPIPIPYQDAFASICGGKDTVGFSEMNNLSLNSWYGISFNTIYNVGKVEQYKPAAYIDTREGVLGVKHKIITQNLEANGTINLVDPRLKDESKDVVTAINSLLGTVSDTYRNRNDGTSFDGTYGDFVKKYNNGTYKMSPENIAGLNLPANIYKYGALHVFYASVTSCTIMYFADNDVGIGTGNGGEVYIYTHYNFSNSPITQFTQRMWKKISFSTNTVQDIRFGATTKVTTWNGRFDSNSYTGQIIFGGYKDEVDGFLDIRYLAPLQKLVDGQWITITPQAI